MYASYHFILSGPLIYFLDLDAPGHSPTVYDLLSNVTHESVAGTTRDKVNTVWKILLRAGGGGGDGERWYEIQDLIVREVRKEMIFLGESVLQVSYEDLHKHSDIHGHCNRCGSEETLLK